MIAGLRRGPHTRRETVSELQVRAGERDRRADRVAAARHGAGRRALHAQPDQRTEKRTKVELVCFCEHVVLHKWYRTCFEHLY